MERSGDSSLRDIVADVVAFHGLRSSAVVNGLQFGALNEASEDWKEYVSFDITYGFLVQLCPILRESLHESVCGGVKKLSVTHAAMVQGLGDLVNFLRTPGNCSSGILQNSDYS